MRKKSCRKFCKISFMKQRLEEMKQELAKVSPVKHPETVDANWLMMTTPLPSKEALLWITKILQYTIKINKAELRIYKQLAGDKYQEAKKEEFGRVISEAPRR